MSDAISVISSEPEQVPVPGDQLLVAAAPETGRDTLTLLLEDLVPDARGEIVILSAGDHDITVVTDQPVANQGLQSAHVTDAGLDVSGFSYCTFASGVTVFCPSTHQLVVLDHA
jgi:hypothetical protein